MQQLLCGLFGILRVWDIRPTAEETAETGEKSFSRLHRTFVKNNEKLLKQLKIV
jgi:hypothetical protein